MRILATHPGRHGDILWALPTVRAISRYFAQPVDFCTSWDYRKVCEVINGQEYIGHAWGALEWKLLEHAPIEPAKAPEEITARYDHVFNLGLTAWPLTPIADFIALQAEERYGIPLRGALAMEEPWIKVKADKPGICVIALGWNELWIELKMGVSFALFQRFQPPPRGNWPVNFHLVYYQDARHKEWRDSFPNHVGRHATDSWLLRAKILQECSVFVGCLGGMWVLANALGMPCVIAEPAEPRWNQAFWREAPQNVLVKGHDGKPTFDARHIGDELEKMLGRVGVSQV